MDAPADVLQIIINNILQEAPPPPFFNDAHKWSYCPAPTFNLAYDTIRSMTLVHRSWTSVAQSRLWARTKLREDQLNHTFGLKFKERATQVKELCVTVGRDCGYFDAMMQVRNLVSLLKQAPNIRSLYISIGKHCEKESTAELLMQLCDQVCLTQLWINGHLAASSLVMMLMLSSNINLKSLVLDCTFITKDEYSTEEEVRTITKAKEIIKPCDIKIKRPRNLNSIALGRNINLYEGAGSLLIHWLLQPASKEAGSGRASMGVKHLDLSHSEFPIISSHTVDIMTACLKNLESLHMKGHISSVFDGGRLVADEVIATAPNLRKLTLRCSGYGVQFSSLPIPTATLTELRVTLTLFTTTEREEVLEMSDTNLASIVKEWGERYQSGRTLVLVLGGYSKEEQETVTAEAFPKTSVACSEKKIELDIRFAILDDHPFMT